MRGSVVLALGLLLLSTTAVAQETPRVLEVTLADLDEDSLDFLIGWERWKGDILDLASEGYARFTFVPLLAVEPGLPLNARFSGRIFAASGQRAAPRSSRRTPRPIRTARAPRDGASEPRTPPSSGRVGSARPAAQLRPAFPLQAPEYGAHSGAGTPRVRCCGGARRQPGRRRRPLHGESPDRKSETARLLPHASGTGRRFPRRSRPQKSPPAPVKSRVPRYERGDCDRMGFRS